MTSNPSPAQPKPAYTVFGAYDDRRARQRRRFGETFYTHNGPPSAEDLARQWLQLTNDDLGEIIIVVVIPGVVACPDASPNAPGDRFAARRKISDKSALDRMTRLLNLPGPWNGGDVCEALCTALIETGRHIYTDL